jgi:hypothetical protein
VQFACQEKDKDKKRRSKRGEGEKNEKKCTGEDLNL